MSGELDRKTIFLTVLIVLFFLIVFAPVYNPLIYRFTTRDTYYSHGFLVPFVSLYLVFRRRKALKAIRPEPFFGGIVVLVFGLIVHLVSLSLKVNFTSYLSIPVVIYGIVLYVGGKNIAREVLFPIAFLIFMLPLPKVLIIGIAFKLKILAGQLATFLVNRVGVEARRAGSTIYYPGGSLLVGDPCSGLRSLITFLALGALFTQFCRVKLWRKSLLFIFAVPVALLSNLLRVTFLLLVGYIYGEKATTGFLHDASGFMVFVLGFLGLLMVSKILKCQLTVENI